MALAPSLDPPILASASADQGVKLWDMSADTEAGEQCGEGGAMVPDGKRGKRLCGIMVGHTADVSHVKWNPVHAVWVSMHEPNPRPAPSRAPRLPGRWRSTVRVSLCR